MHETGLAYELLRLAVKFAEGKRISRVGVSVGALSGVESASLKFALEALAEECGAAGAEMEVTLVRAEGECALCGKVSEAESRFAVCPHCGAPVLEITKGEEFTLAFIDTDD